MLQKEIIMENADFIIYQENSLFGLKDKSGNIIIPPQYTNFNPFSCGLAMVRNASLQYAYINIDNTQIIPFGLYSWCDSSFCWGLARAVKDGKWGIINTQGNIILPFQFDKIYPLKDEYIFRIKTFINENEYILDINKILYNYTLLDGLIYIKTFPIDSFKKLYNIELLRVFKEKETNLAYFSIGCGKGYVAFDVNNLPKSEICISIVSNINGNLFFLAHTKEDTGKECLKLSYYKREEPKLPYNYTPHHVYYSNDEDSSYDDCRDYYDGWSREDVESGLADAFEGDLDAYWNID